MQREEKERKKGKTGEVKSTPDKNTDEGTRDIFLLIPMSMKKIIWLRNECIEEQALPK